MPVALINLPMFAISDAIAVANRAGVLPTASFPPSANFSLISVNHIAIGIGFKRVRRYLGHEETAVPGYILHHKMRCNIACTQ